MVDKLAKPCYNIHTNEEAGIIPNLEAKEAIL
jgi:hypothetical protein